MRDGEDLAVLPEPGEVFTDGGGYRATDTGIGFIEHQRACGSQRGRR